MSFSEEDRRIFHEEVTKVFGDLASKGFYQTNVELCSTAALGEYLEIAVLDQKRGKGLRISLTRTPDGLREALIVALERGETDTFTVGEYLKHQGIDAGLVRQCKLSAYHGSLEERISCCLSFTRQQIDKYLLEALTGTKWPDVPMDWGDYK